MSHTSHAVDMAQQPIGKLFWRYAVPTIVSMLATGVYVTVDGMFIGHFLGEQGLAAITLAYPVGAVIYAIGALIGMGGAALASLQLGKGQLQAAKQIVANTLLLGLVAGVLVAVLGISLREPVLRLLGVSGDILNYAKTYLFWYFLCGVLPILSMSFSAMLRNDGFPGRVTWIQIGCGVLNIVLDWLLIVVIPLEFAGVAIATMLCQGVAAWLCLRHFFSDKTQLRLTRAQLKFSWLWVKSILRLGLPSMMMSLYLSVVLTLHNIAFLWQGEPIHIAAYGVVSYTEAMFYLIFEGIALGAQPIMSFNAGAGLMQRVRQIALLAFGVTATVALLGMLLIYSKPEWMVYLFAGDNPTLAPYAIEGLYLYFWGLAFEGLLLVGASLFQAMDRPKEANMLTGSKLVLIGILIFSLGKLFGVTGVWLAMSCCSSVLIIWMLRRFIRLNRRLLAS
ncbi:MATE family efflux transporter [Shewanella sp. A3A]|nr:MATE family efflux transporter [Shewanella ferrihydritica]